MPEVLEIEQVEARTHSSEKAKIASWVIDIPKDIIEELNLPEKSQLALRIKNGEVSGDLLLPLSEELENLAMEILHKRRKLYGELKRIGD
jgi:hypothetical protein